VSRRLRWLLISVLIALVILAGIAIGSWYFLRAHGPLLARERIEEALGRALERPVKIGEVVLQPWLGRVQILNVEIGPQAGAGGEPLLRLGRAQIRIGISSIWHREVVVSRVLLEDLDLRLAASGPSARPFVLDIPDRFEVGPLTVRVQSVQVHRGQVFYQDRSQGLGLEFQGVGVSARPLDRGIDASLEAASVRLRLPTLREEFTNIRASGWIHQERASLRSLTARWAGREIRVSGEIRQPFDAPSLGLRVRGEVDVAAVARSAKAPWPVAGTAGLDGALEGPTDAFRVSGRLQMSTLAAGPVQAKAVAVSGDVRGLPKAPDLHLQVQGDIDLAPLGVEAKAPWPVSGMARAEGRVEGSPGTLRVTGRVTSPAVSAGPLQAHAVAVSGDVRGLPKAPDLHLQVQGDIDLAPLGVEAKAPWPVSGAAHAVVRVDGPPGGLLLGGRVSIPEVTGGPLRARDVALEGQWKGGQLDLAQIRARVFGGELRGSLHTNLDRLHESRASATLTHAALTQLDALAPAPLGLRGEVDAEATLEGDPRQLADLSGRVRLAGREIVLPRDLSRLGAGTVAVEGGVRKGVLEITRASGVWPAARIEASGPVGLEGPQGTQILLDADLARLLPLWDVRQVGGQAHIAGVLRGPWDNPAVTGRARAPVLAVAGTRIDAVELPFRIEDRLLTLTSVDGVLGQSRIEVTGHLAWRIPGNGQAGTSIQSAPFSGVVRAPAVRMEDLSHWLPPDWQGAGRFALEGRLEGTLGAWRGSGSVKAAALNVRSTIPVRDLQARFTLDGQHVEVESVQASVRGLPLHASGTWRWDGTGRAEAEIGPVDLSSLPEVPPTAGLRGRAQARVEVTAAPGRLEVHGTGAVEDVQVLDYPLGKGTLQATLHDGSLQADLAFPEARLAASVRGRTDRDEPFAVRAEVSGLEVAPLLRRVGATGGVRIGGSLSAVAAFTVPMGRPADAQGTVRLDPVRLVVEEEPWTNQGPVLLRWGPDGLRIERLQLASRLGSARASGRVERADALDLEVDGQVPLAILPAFQPEVRSAEGLLSLTIRVNGTTDKPRIAGEATVRDGKLQLASYPETFRELTGRVQISPAGLRLVEATALVGRGRLRASGEMTLNGWRPGVYRFALTGREVAVAPFEGLRTTWDADLELVGQGDRAQLRGEANLVQGTYVGQLSLLSLILSQRQERPAAPSFALPLRIQLQFRDNLRVETNLARLTVGGTLSLEGTTANPILFGTLESHEGRITFRKNRYDLLAAAVRFTDPRKIDPILDVTGRARIRDYDITVRLTGRAENLNVRFSSTPPLDEEELLLLTTLGLTKEEAAQSPAGVAAGQVVQLLLDEILGPEVSGYGLDVLEVQSTDTTQKGEAGTKQTSVRVGKQVTEDLRVLYSQSIAGASKRILRVEYQVIGPLFLAGEQDFQGGVGGDVLIRLRFR
jgi:autotransporter translocation and assembly factor TamB